ncbi:MAG: hypothetical protein R6U64_02965 [Bacteroidales bacterium]
MNTSSFFSLQRFFLVLRRDMVLNQKTLLIGLAAMSGLLLVQSVIQTYASGGVFSLEAFSGSGITYFFVFGYVVASMVFKELHVPARSQFFLTLPASNLEKVAAAWVVSAPLYVVGVFLALTLISLLAALLNALLFGSALLVFNPFTTMNLYAAGVFLVTHSIFFLGAVYFRKNNFLKTILSLFVISVAISMLAGLMGYLFFGTTSFTINEQTTIGTPDFITEFLPTMAKIVFWGIVGPFFLIVSYFRFKEREV